jgi:hypothetical protein
VRVGRAAHCRSGLGVLSFFTSFYGNGETKFPDKAAAEHGLVLSMHDRVFVQIRGAKERLS